MFVYKQRVGGAGGGQGGGAGAGRPGGGGGGVWGGRVRGRVQRAGGGRGRAAGGPAMKEYAEKNLLSRPDQILLPTPLLLNYVQWCPPSQSLGSSCAFR